MTLAMILAQAAPASGPAAIFMNILPIAAVLLVFYFLVMRPQQQKISQHQQMVNNLKKGDTVITSGGLIGKVQKVSDEEVSLELGPNVIVRVVRAMIQEVRGVTVANDAKPK